MEDAHERKVFLAHAFVVSYRYADIDERFISLRIVVLRVLLGRT